MSGILTSITLPETIATAIQNAAEPANHAEILRFIASEADVARQRSIRYAALASTIEYYVFDRIEQTPMSLFKDILSSDPTLISAQVAKHTFTTPETLLEKAVLAENMLIVDLLLSYGAEASSWLQNRYADLQARGVCEEIMARLLYTLSAEQIAAFRAQLPTGSGIAEEYVRGLFEGSLAIVADTKQNQDLMFAFTSASILSSVKKDVPNHLRNFLSRDGDTAVTRRVFTCLCEPYTASQAMVDINPLLAFSVYKGQLKSYLAYNIRRVNDEADPIARESARKESLRQARAALTR